MKNRLCFTFIVLFLLISGCNGTNDNGGTDPPIDEEEITVASWNLKSFGQTKLNDSARINVIVSVLKKCDIIAIQEVQDSSFDPDWS